MVGGFIGTAHYKSKSSSTVHEGHLCKFHALVHSPSSDMRWAIREAAGRIDRIWVLSSTRSVQLAMNTAAEVSTPRPVTFDGWDGNDWGVNWPSIEDAALGLNTLPEIKREPSS